MRKCPKCGGRLRRVHRTLLERFRFLAIYACRDCHLEEPMPRHFQLHLGVAARCPKCGTFRIVRLKEPDHIDPMHTGFLNMLERMVGGRLYHCRFCRIQFFDRRRLASEVAAADAEEQAEMEAAEEPQPTVPDSNTGQDS